MTKQIKRRIVVFLSIWLFLTMIPIHILAADTSAAKVKIEQIEGTVKVERSTGKQLKARKGMHLINGYTLITSKKSYAYVSLDSTKSLKVDENSKIEVRKKGKKIELFVKTGKIFFNVAKPLQAKETMNIKTSTMTMGIRGTSGTVIQNTTEKEPYTQIQLYDGKSEIVTKDLLTGNERKETIVGGEVITIAIQEKKETIIKKETISDNIGAVPEFALIEIEKDEELLNKMKEEFNFNMEEFLEYLEKILHEKISDFEVIVFDKITSKQIEKDVIYGIINKKIGKEDLSYTGKFYTAQGEVEKIAKIQQAIGNQALAIQFKENKMIEFKCKYSPFTINQSFLIPEGVKFTGNQKQILIISPKVVVSGGMYEDSSGELKEINGEQNGLYLEYNELKDLWIRK